MEKIMIVTSVSEAREFTGNDGSKIKAMDITLSDGVNSIVASAVDKRAQRIIENPIKIGSLLNVDLTFYIQNVKSDKGEFASQRVRLNDFGIIVAP